MGRVRVVLSVAALALPRYATTTDLRQAGIRLPQDVVAHRRHIADGLAWGAVASMVVLSAAAFAEHRRRRT